MRWKVTFTIAATLVVVSAALLGGCSGRDAAPASTPAGAAAPAAPTATMPPPPPPPGSADRAAAEEAAWRAAEDTEQQHRAAKPPPPAMAKPPAARKAKSAKPDLPDASPAGPPVSRCATADLAPFPWPSPPQPSVTALVPPYLLFGPDVKATTLAAIAARLEGAIASAGYRQPKYLGAGCSGFAIVLDLEHIDTDGTRKAGTAGFAPPSQDEGFSLSDYVKRLFYAPPGQYRQIVIVVSDQRMAVVTAPPTEAQLRAIARDGVSSLPTNLGALPYTPTHVVLALIYEFEKGPRNGDAKVIPPVGRLGATVHLEKARLF